ncbi:hypothetical protein B0H13DRAFT_1866115 [Mycena leptocephala]|nr:hypothetical protein B0H13DRAFT_1866115 [Mycena leptocephala]
MAVTSQNTLLSGLDPMHSSSLTPDDLSHPQNPRIGLIAGGKPQLQIQIDCPRLVEGLNISSAFRLAGITKEEEGLALRLKPCPGGLWGMVQNHRRASVILERFGLSATTGNSRIEFEAGLKLTTENEVRAMFRVGGFCDQPHGPKSENFTAETERRAATLTQNHLIGLAARLDPYLQKPST